MSESTQLERVQPASPMMGLIEAAAVRGDMAMVEKFMDLKDRNDATEARKAFVAAMAAFKGETIHVSKDKDNLQYKSKYVSLGNLVSTVTPFLSKHGLSVRWDLDQTAGIKVTCILTHQMGHSESVFMTCPPDKSGAKNPIQEIKSAITYAKACTFESICGLASTDANVDDDGNGTSKPSLPEDAVSDWLEHIKTAANNDELKSRYLEAQAAAKKIDDKRASDMFSKTKDARYRALNPPVKKDAK